MNTRASYWRAIQRMSILLPVVAAGCSIGASDTPPESMAKEYVEHTVIGAKKLRGAASIEAFKKTDGWKQTTNGVEQYLLEFEMEAVFSKGLMPECLDKARFNNKCFDAQLDGLVPRPVGARERWKGKVLFQKTEKGWRPIDLL